MSFFQDARSKFAAKFKSDTPDKPNPYYQEYLNEKDKEFIAGFDYVADEQIGNFFDNFEDAIAIVNEGLEVKGVDFDKVDTDLLRKDRDDNEDVLADIINEKVTVNEETKAFLLVQRALLSWIEMNRNEMITGMLDDMNEEEYKENYKKVWGHTPDEESGE